MTTEWIVFLVSYVFVGLTFFFGSLMYDDSEFNWKWAGFLPVCVLLWPSILLAALMQPDKKLRGKGPKNVPDDNTKVSKP